MIENEEMSMAQKLEVFRQVTSYGVGSGYEPNGERGPVVIEVPEFTPARITTTEIHSGSPVSSAEFDEPSIGGGTAPETLGPWHISLTNDGEDWKWAVAAEGSTIIDGTNGNDIDLGAIFGGETIIDGTKYIILKGTVTPATLAIATPWEFIAIDDDSPEGTKEIELDDDDPVGQIGLRLLIGKIVFESGDPRVIQGETRPQFVDFGFFQGVAVKNFIPPPVAAASLT